MIAEIIAAGSEMLTPYRQDTNSLYLTEGLNDLGVTVAFKTIVGDNLEHLTNAARIAIARADIVLFSGGLGPTEDDLTREAAAAALGRSLRRDNALLVDLAKRFAARRMTMPSNNLRQTDIIDGATILNNANGSAPGQYLDVTIDGERKIVILLPGPPKELKPLFTDVVVPMLAKSLPPRYLAKRMLRMALIPESQVDARTAPIYQQYPDVETTILAGSAEIQLHFFCAKPTAEEAQDRIDELSGRIEQEMGDSIFSSNGESLEEIVLLHLGMRHLSLAVAESCTGGLLSERLTSVPNSSTAFSGGVVVYNEQMKSAFADVPPELFERHGAVSPQVARALAEGIRARANTSLGIGITGLAGPAGGTGADALKPIGLVYIALSEGEDTQVKEFQINGDRDRVRFWATQHALEFIRQTLL
ncbi:competence/damage-inducible protein A [Granulicella sibirica]|uniref:CinA-like protein n=1 Tax=Granulicella sibirica TaxID=2479048 RepID=A0A4Q0SVV8_9BACT|nr:competence/damage-inducible protein A [Granulicella sibirica]RXH55183.1 Molybdopterin binding motif, CinA N-terminal domain / C-terminal domain of CinA type S [Granulicella sibirica]